MRPETGQFGPDNDNEWITEAALSNVKNERKDILIFNKRGQGCYKISFAVYDEASFGRRTKHEYLTLKCGLMLDLWAQQRAMRWRKPSGHESSSGIFGLLFLRTLSMTWERQQMSTSCQLQVEHI